MISIDACLLAVCLLGKCYAPLNILRMIFSHGVVSHGFNVSI